MGKKLIHKLIDMIALDKHDYTHHVFFVSKLSLKIIKEYKDEIATLIKLNKSDGSINIYIHEVTGPSIKDFVIYTYFDLIELKYTKATNELIIEVV